MLAHPFCISILYFKQLKVFQFKTDWKFELLLSYSISKFMLNSIKQTLKAFEFPHEVFEKSCLQIKNSNKLWDNFPLSVETCQTCMNDSLTCILWKILYVFKISKVFALGQIGIKWKCFKYTWYIYICYTYIICLILFKCSFKAEFGRQWVSLTSSTSHRRRNTINYLHILIKLKKYEFTLETWSFTLITLRVLKSSKNWRLKKTFFELNFLSHKVH